MKSVIEGRFAIGLVVSLVASAFARAGEGPEFGADVAPIFAKYCLSCHGHDDPDGGLVLERHATLLKGGESGAAILPGKSAGSLLVRLIDSSAKEVMPPGKRKKLTADEIVTIKKWIDAGALAPKDDVVIVPKGDIPKIKPKVTPKKPILAIGESIPAKLVAIARHGDVELREAGTLVLRAKLTGHTGAVNAVAFSKSGKMLATVAGTAGVSGEIKLWNTSDGKLIRAWTGHTDAIYAAAISPDGSLLATGSYDQKIMLWNIYANIGEKGPGEPRVLSGHNGAIFSLAFRPDGKVLASASGDRTVKLWETATGNRLDTLSQPLKEQNACAFSPDGTVLIAGGADSRIRMWKIGETALDGTNPLQEAVFAHEGAVLKLAYSPDGKTIYSSGEDRAVKSWNAEKVAQKIVFDMQPDWVTGLSVSADGKSVLVGRIDGSFAEMDAMTGKVKKGELTGIFPRGIQRGVATKIKLSGKNLVDVTAVKIGSMTIKSELMGEGATLDGVWAMVTPDATTPRGSVDVSVVSASGESLKQTLIIDDLPQVSARETNGMAGDLQDVVLPASVWGEFKKPGDANVFRFVVKAGQTIVFDVATSSLKSKARVTIKLSNDHGKRVAPVQNDVGAEPLLAFKIPEDGRYTARVDEATLAGTKDHFFRVSVGEFGYVESFYPLAIPARAETDIQLRGYNLPAGMKVAVKAGEAGDVIIPLDKEKFRTRSGLKALAIDVPEVKEVEPNDTPESATAMSAPGAAEGRIFSTSGQGGGDVDCYRFESKRGRTWVIETVAAQRGSPVDTKIEVLDAKGNAIPRMQLCAVRDSYINFRSIDSIILGVRLKNWEEMELNNYVYMQGEVCRLFRAPQGPDSDSLLYNSTGGSRRAYFDTSSTAHANEEPVYIVEPHPVGEKLAPNGLPVFTLNYVNDDDGERRLGRDSRLTFTAPAEGSYIVRVTDTRGESGEDFVYHLMIREPKPDFVPSIAMGDLSVNAGSGKSFTITVDRIDGFDEDVRVEISGAPPGITIASPIVVQAGHRDASGVVFASEGAKQPSEAELKIIQIVATAKVNGKTVEKRIAAFPAIKLDAKPKLFVMLAPSDKDGVKTPLDVTIVPGQTVPVLLKVRRNGHEELITFSVDNLPHGVIVDNIGLSGVLLEKGLSERQIFLTAERWVPETDRLCFAVEKQAGLQTSQPVMLHVRKK